MIEIKKKPRVKHAREINALANDGSFRTLCGVRYVDGSAPGSEGGATSWLSEVTCRRCRALWAPNERAKREARRASEEKIADPQTSA